jgi:hypothetical protein
MTCVPTYRVKSKEFCKKFIGKRKLLNTGRAHVLQTDELKQIRTGKQVLNYSTGPEAEQKQKGR